ncbi:MAG: GAF domain-containing sensor histidine kinase [Chloroflexota bacterium]
MLRKTTSLKNGRKAIYLSLFLFTLGVIIWSAIILWQTPCPEGSPLSWTTLSPCRSSPQSLVALVVALGFWSISLAIWLSGRKNRPITFLLLVAGIVSSGELPPGDTVLGWHLFNVLLAWSSPALFHFHLRFLQQQPPFQKQAILVLLSIVALLLTIPPLFWSPSFSEQQAWFSLWYLSIRLAPLLALILTTGLLWREYQQSASIVNRRHIRLITIGTLLAFTPTALLSLLPSTLGAEVYMPYALTFPWLLIAPLTHLYLFFPDRLLQYWELLQPVVVTYILIVLLTAVYLAAMIITLRLDIAAPIQWLLLSVLLNIGLLFLFARLKATVGQFAEWVWHGREEDYTDLVATLSESLALTGDRQTLHHLLLSDLPRIMDLSGAAIFLSEYPDSLVLDGNNGQPDLEKGSHLSLSGELARSLKKEGRPLTGAQLRRQLTGAALPAAEQKLLSLTALALWLPLISGKRLQGLLLLGPKQSGAVFTPVEKRVLAALAYQAGSAVHNIRLGAEVQTRQQELARAHRQLLLTQEQERHRLARWLHDSIIQQLLGLSYQLADTHKQVKIAGHADGPQAALPQPVVENVRQEMLGLVARLRRVIGDLRPAGLDELGLSTAIEGYVARLQREQGAAGPLIEPTLDLVGTTLPEPVAICLFRVAQEGVRNALKHAQATLIQISLIMNPEEIILRIEDDGRGFHLPARLGQLAERHHFGLIGIAEQVNAVAGCFTIDSQPDSGTRIWVRIPLIEKEDNHV